MSQSFTKTLAKCVYFHRKQSGLSREALAELAGVGKALIYNIEHGKETIQLKTLLMVLDTLNIQLELKGPLMKAFEESIDA